MNYYWITCSEDGIAIQQFTKKQVEETLKEETEQGIEHTFLDHVPEIDKGCWYEDAGLLIKGEIVVPKAKKVATVYEVG